MPDPGTLTLVGTPLGNLEDITLRAERVLRECDIVAAEDTRRTLQLLNHLGCPKRLIPCHEHNWKEAVPVLLGLLREGKNIACCTDAGMPCISDPGWQLVAACRENGIPVTSAPGPTAVATAAALSGFDSGRFAFEAFLPRQGRERKDRLRALKGEERMIILYEAPHRLVRTVEDLAELWPERRIALCKDLTKKFERLEVLPLAELRDNLSAQEEKPLGEYVLVIEPMACAPEEETPDTPEDLLRRLRDAEVPKKEAVRSVTESTGLPRREIYALAEAVWDEEEEE